MNHRELVARQREERDRRLDAATAALRAFLAEGPAPWLTASRLVCQAAGCGPRDVAVACARLGVVAARYTWPDGRGYEVWRLPDQQDPAGVVVAILPQRDDPEAS